MRGKSANATHRAAAVVLACLALLRATYPPVLAVQRAIDATPETSLATPRSSPPQTLATPQSPPPQTSAPTPQGPTLPAAFVHQPRLTGYFVGDLLTQSVLLQRDAQTLTPVTLPTSGRVSAWFERRRVAVVTDANTQRWLTIEYQILNAPPKLTAATLPAWKLRVTNTATGAPITLEIPAVTINIAPLSLPGSPGQVGTHDLRPDHVPPPLPLAPIRRDLAVSLIALALTLIAWLGWTLWRNRQATATQPFARALREIQTLDDKEPRAWQALHRAFDRTAGHVIQSATLPTLFERAPQLTPARTQIEDFFTQSSLLFFGSGTPNITPRALCTELRRIERRHER